MKKIKKRLKMSKFERLIYTFTLVLVLLTPFALVFSQATLSEVNFEVEKLTKSIDTQEKKNESLTMKVSELTSFDKVKDIVNAMGLEYNNDNIIIINQN